MTLFNFPTVGKKLEFNEFPKVPIVEADGPLASVREEKLETHPLKDQLFAHTSQSIRFLQANDLVPPLPPQVDVVFTSVNLVEHLANRFKGFVGKEPPPQYKHLACADPATATIYVSSSYLTNSNRYADFTTELQVLNIEFGGDIRKILEREFFHEIGHLALREKFKHKRSQKDARGLLAVLKLNIEEGFADAFSLHLMGLKHPEQQQFPHLRAYMEKLSQGLEADQVSDVDVYRVYDLVPLTRYQVPLQDIGHIVEGCWHAALQNSKAMLLLKMKENPYFKQDVMKAIDADTDNPQGVVAQFHKQVQEDGFDAKKILAVRSFYSNKKEGNQLRPLK